MPSYAYIVAKSRATAFDPATIDLLYCFGSTFNTYVRYFGVSAKNFHVNIRLD